ncbi:hypothetical protein MRX96_029843 [Rhipicephalus microplus]
MRGTTRPAVLRAIYDDGLASDEQREKAAGQYVPLARDAGVVLRRKEMPVEPPPHCSGPHRPAAQEKGAGHSSKRARSAFSRVCSPLCCCWAASRQSLHSTSLSRSPLSAQK